MRLGQFDDGVMLKRRGGSEGGFNMVVEHAALLTCNGPAELHSVACRMRAFASFCIAARNASVYFAIAV